MFVLFCRLLPTATTIANKFMNGKNLMCKTKVYSAYEMPRLKITAIMVVAVKNREPVYAHIQIVTNAKPVSNRTESDTNNRSNNVLFKPNCIPFTQNFPYDKPSLFNSL